MTTRRGFLAALAGAAAWLAGGRAARGGREPIVGDVSERARINVDRWWREFDGCRLLLDGTDVTNRCSFCNPAQGWCDLVEVDASGQIAKQEVARTSKGQSVSWFVPTKRHFGDVRVVA